MPAIAAKTSCGMGPFEYRDPLERLETRRRVKRRARALRKKVDRMTAEAAGGRALRDARQELAAYEPADG